MRIYSFFLFLILLSSCSKIPVPSIISPSENTNVQPVSFGEEPTNYQKILKDFLINNLENSKTARIEFINAPSKISINHLGNNYVGYRVWLSINQKRGEYYLGYKNHWRTVEESLLTFLTSKKMLERHWDKLMEMATVESFPYESALHKIYKIEKCFSPIPSLAMHCTLSLIHI